MSPAGLRAAALAAALVLAVLSRGDVIVLAALLAIGAWRPLPAVAVTSALVATAWRWGSTALGDVAGAQAVLGLAGVVEPATAAIAAWLGALAIVVATPDLVEAWGRDVARRDDLDIRSGRVRGTATRISGFSFSVSRPLAVVLTWVPRGASGAAAALVVAGPAPGGALWARGLATVVGISLATWIAQHRRSHPVTSGRRRRRLPRSVIEVTATVLGVASLGLVAIDVPALDGTFDSDALVQGLVLGVAVAAVAWAGGAAVAHARQTRRQS